MNNKGQSLVTFVLLIPVILFIMFMVNTEDIISHCVWYNGNVYQKGTTFEFQDASVDLRNELLGNPYYSNRNYTEEFESEYRRLEEGLRFAYTLAVTMFVNKILDKDRCFEIEIYSDDKTKRPFTILLDHPSSKELEELTNGKKYEMFIYDDHGEETCIIYPDNLVTNDEAKALSNELIEKNYPIIKTRFIMCPKDYLKYFS